MASTLGKGQNSWVFPYIFLAEIVLEHRYRMAKTPVSSPLR